MVRHLFVYGTLMPGHGRWPALAPWVEGGPSPDFITGALYDTGYGWPAAVIGPGADIPGFTVALEARSLPAALNALDEIEGTSHGLFCRVQLLTAHGVAAWAYDWAGETAGFAAIDGWT
jgi:gamma-glutamylcyclotransferase (GGCT)/AIG2-like uncharacterized protein YtfP